MRNIAYVILILLFASCSSTRKAVSRLQQDVKKTSFFQKDSTGRLTVDVVSVKNDSAGTVTKTDSNYDRITEEVITEIKTDSGEYRETKRIIKEKGQKRSEQATKAERTDSIHTTTTHQVHEKEQQRADSSVTVVAQDKAVKRISFLPWWICLLALVAGVLVWWKRNSIIDFFI